MPPYPRGRGVQISGAKIFPSLIRSHLATREGGILIDGTRVLLIWDEPMQGVDRPWFECPVCKHRCQHLYLRQLACRRSGRGVVFPGVESSAIGRGSHLSALDPRTPPYGLPVGSAAHIQVGVMTNVC